MVALLSFFHLERASCGHFFVSQREHARGEHAKTDWANDPCTSNCQQLAGHRAVQRDRRPSRPRGQQKAELHWNSLVSSAVLR